MGDDTISGGEGDDGIAGGDFGDEGGPAADSSSDTCLGQRGFDLGFDCQTASGVEQLLG